MSEQSLLSRALSAAERNSALSGRDLREAGAMLANIARARSVAVVAADAAGERIIGAALALGSSLRLLDRTRRADDLSVLVVAGWVAGPYDIITTASIMRATGAAHVHVVLLNSDMAAFEGCDTVTRLRGPWRATLVA